jgi:hypothetical protein
MGYEDVNPHKKLYLAYRFKAILPFLRYSWPDCEVLSPAAAMVNLGRKGVHDDKKENSQP